jgi:hypothetical protein
MRNYLAELDGEFQNTPTLPTARTEKSPSCSFCSAQGAPVSKTEGTPDPGTRRLWTITEADGTSWVSSFTPPVTMAQVQERFPGATVEAADDRPAPDPRTLSARDQDQVEAALDAAGETHLDIRREVLGRCAGDPEALRFWVARVPDPRPDLCASWLSGIDEERVLMTLSDDQVQVAVAAGVVPRDLARGSVLVLVRSPAGDLGPGAVGLLAIPKDRYADFSPLTALEALSWRH